MPFISAQFSFHLLRLSEAIACSALLALAEQQEGGIRWLRQADEREDLGGGLTNESRQVRLTDVKGWEGRKRQEVGRVRGDCVSAYIGSSTNIPNPD